MLLTISAEWRITILMLMLCCWTKIKKTTVVFQFSQTTQTLLFSFSKQFSPHPVILQKLHSLPILLNISCECQILQARSPLICPRNFNARVLIISISVLYVTISLQTSSFLTCSVHVIFFAPFWKTSLLSYDSKYIHIALNLWGNYNL